MDSREYWNNKIVDWENSQHQGQRTSLFEQFAALFRGPLVRRSEVTFELLGSFPADKTVIEIGCGSGYFALEMHDRCRPRHVTGVDISENAIDRARAMVSDKGLVDALAFRTGEACEAVTEEADITIGLGLLDYLSATEITRLFSEMRSRYFLFSFAERRMMTTRLLHIAYMKSQRCPKHFYYTEREMRECVGERFSDVRYVRDPKLWFGCIVHNIPS